MRLNESTNTWRSQRNLCAIEWNPFAAARMTEHLPTPVTFGLTHSRTHSMVHRWWHSSCYVMSLKTWLHRGVGNEGAYSKIWIAMVATCLWNVFGNCFTFFHITLVNPHWQPASSIKEWESNHWFANVSPCETKWSIRHTPYENIVPTEAFNCLKWLPPFLWAYRFHPPIPLACLLTH